MKDRLLAHLDPICIHNADDSYFLYFEVGGRGFHSPLWGYYDDPKIIKEKYPDLEIVEIGTLTTFGRDINELVSVQFVRKMLAALEDGTAELKLD